MYVVKRREGDKDFYVRAFHIEGIPARAVPVWDARQHLAFRRGERNSAANVAFDVDGRVVRLKRRAAPEVRRAAERAMAGACGSPAEALDALAVYLEGRLR